MDAPLRGDPTLGYLGHMWELYAMWAWVGLYLAANFAARRGAAVSPREAVLATFAVIAAGAAGCVQPGCWLIGWVGSGLGCGPWRSQGPAACSPALPSGCTRR